MLEGNCEEILEGMLEEILEGMLEEMLGVRRNVRRNV